MVQTKIVSAKLLDGTTILNRRAKVFGSHAANPIDSGLEIPLPLQGLALTLFDFAGYPGWRLSYFTRIALLGRRNRTDTLGTLAVLTEAIGTCLRKPSAIVSVSVTSILETAYVRSHEFPAEDTPVFRIAWIVLPPPAVYRDGGFV